MADFPTHENLFLALGKYAARQDENLLTQSFMVLFNKVPSFRERFVEALQKTGNIYSSERKEVSP